MVYVPGYESDIFVSYAHVDDYCLPGDNSGWVTRLIKQFLEPFTNARLGSRGTLKMWMDHELEAGQPITPQLLNQVRRAATLVVVLSPSYINSPWCRRERENFLNIVRERGCWGVFLIEPEEVSFDNRPEELRDLKCFRFWAPSNHEGGAPCPLGTTRDLEDEFKKRAIDLSYAIATELRRMREGQEKPGDRVQASPGISDHSQTPLVAPKRTVFLAQVADDLHTQRDSVKHYLEQQGFRVVPDDLYWWEPQAFREVVARDLERADLFVQLLGALSPRKPKGLPRGYLWCQFDLAKEASKRTLQWRDPRLDRSTIEDADHRALVEGENVIAEPLEDFKKAMFNTLNRVPDPVPISRTNVEVFVARDQADQPLAEQICDMLEHCGAGWSRSLLGEEGHNPQVYREDMEERIRECDAMIVVYGQATALWVRRQLGELRKKLAELNKPAAALAVFDGPPEPKLNVEAKPIPYMKIVNCRHGVCEREIREFLDEARRFRHERREMA